MMNQLSPKWKEVSKNWLGIENGQHCHWCEFAIFEEGEVYCSHPKSKFNDGDRIRTWDGELCAKECGYFNLNIWYTKDENYKKYFNQEK